MIVIGLLLLVVVVLAALAAVVRGGDAVRVDLEWFTIKTNVGVVFFAGAAAVILLLLAGWLLLAGMKRGRRRRAEVRALRQRAEANEAAAHSERLAPSTEPTRKLEEPRGRDADDYFDSAPRDT